MEFDIIIGIETHIQLATKSKLFCSCANATDPIAANLHICPVCLGHPGTLPVLNKQALDWAIMMALALHMDINKELKFDRKNYFYPDLPKGYQISQLDQPVGEHGYILIGVGSEQTKIGITRLHLEEDAAKNIHTDDATLVDYNRSGSPLVEIVSEPQLRSPEEAKAYVQELRLIARYLGISDADMEKGQLRCDANISLRPRGQKELATKTEIKNINSFRFIAKALAYEVERQKQLWLEGNPPTVQTTRGWNEHEGRTYEQRVKEDSDDYRYFPEPDLPLLEISSGMLREISKLLVELPADKRDRFAAEYGLPTSDINLLVDDKAVADYFEHVVSELRDWLTTEIEGDSETIWQDNRKKIVKLAFNWISSELFKLLKINKQAITDISITPENMAEFITLVYQNKVNSSAAQTILAEMYKSGADPTHVMEDKDLGQMEAGEELDKVLDLIVAENSEQAEEYRQGKESLLQFFIGLGMKATKGKANPQDLAKIFKDKLK
ncbi:MAG: Asp-tRNA(Asn)/Glu-tRNA(Gln) amidotransferase subunit GatB [Candidatus Komeilibacteria bacterium]